MMTMRTLSWTVMGVSYWNAPFVGDASVDSCFGRPWVVGDVVGRPALVLKVLLVVLVISLVLLVAAVIVVLPRQRIGSVSRAKAEMTT